MLADSATALSLSPVLTSQRYLPCADSHVPGKPTVVRSPLCIYNVCIENAHNDGRTRCTLREHDRLALARYRGLRTWTARDWGSIVEGSLPLLLRPDLCVHPRDRANGEWFTDACRAASDVRSSLRRLRAPTVDAHNVLGADGMC